MGNPKKRKPLRGAGFSVTIPTEPLASAAKNVPLMAVMVQDEGVKVLEYDVKEGNSIEFRVGGTMRAFMQRVGPAPDGSMFIDATAGNKQPVVVDFEHALSGPQHFVLAPGQRLTVNPVAARRWVMSAQKWE